MEPRERELALEVLSAAWARLADMDSPRILATVRDEAAVLPARYPDVSAEFAEHIGDAAVWYLDRATRRVDDPDRDGLTAAQRATNLSLFNASASNDDIERLFAVATALSSEDV